MKKDRINVKRTIAAICATVMMLSLVACGSEPTGNEAGGQGNTSGASNTVGIAQDNGYAGPNYEISKDIYGLVKSEEFGIKYEYDDHVYDDNHQLIQVAKDVWGGDDSVLTYTCNEQGLVTAIKEVYNDGGYLETAITYNANRQKETETFTSDVSEKNGDTYTYTYEYDEAGRPSNMTCTSALTDYVKTEKYYYRENGKLDRIDVVESDWSYIISGYMYDENDNCIFSNIYSAETGEAIYWNSFEYDDVDSYVISSTEYAQLNTSDQWLYFKEATWLPTPDSVMNSVTFDSVRENNGHNIYRFLMSEDNDTARADRYLYYQIVEEVCDADYYDDLTMQQFAKDANAITETQVVVHWSTLDASVDGRVYIDICFPTEEFDEYDILGIERPKKHDYSNSSGGESYAEGSDWENYDSDGDGKINDQEFQDGMNAAIDDMLKEME